MRDTAVRSLVAVAALLVAGCTSTGPDASDGAPTPAVSGSPGAGASPSPEPDPPAADVPEAGLCYRLGYEEAVAPTTRSRPVDCDARHDAQTVHVGRMDTFVDGHALAVDSDHVQRQVSRACRRELARAVGGSAEDRALSRFEVVWFGPTIEESDEGARWFRCDVVALATSGRLAALPPPGRLRGILEDASGRAAYGLCGTAAPGTRGFERVICSRKHAWRAVATIPLSGGAAYPGARAVRADGDRACADRVRAEAADPLDFEYGWEWPTRAQWRDGQRYGLCWAPA